MEKEVRPRLLLCTTVSSLVSTFVSTFLSVGSEVVQKGLGKLGPGFSGAFNNCIYFCMVFESHLHIFFS